METIFDRDFYEKLNKLKQRIRFQSIPGTGLSGNRKSGSKGTSLEFSDFREYILGDDLRRIDWNAYGRTERLLVKLFVEEKEALFTIIVDCSKSMDFGRNHKGRCAARIAAAMAFLILDQMDRVRVVSCIDRYMGRTESAGQNPVFCSKTMTGHQAFSKILKQLEEICFLPEYDIYNVIKEIKTQSKGIMVLLTDGYLEQKPEEILKVMMHRKQKVIVFHILSDEELAPDMEGTLNLIDSETAKKARVTMNASALKAYDASLSHFVSDWRSACRKYGAVYNLVSSSLPLDEVMMQFMINSGGKIF